MVFEKQIEYKTKTMQQIESIIFRFSYPKYTKLGKHKTWKNETIFVINYNVIIQNIVLGF